MIHILFSIRDSKAETFTIPFPMLTKAEAIRGFVTEVSNPKSGFLHTNSEDFSLFEMGTFDTDDGKFVIHPAPIHIANALEFKKMEITSKVDI